MLFSSGSSKDCSFPTRDARATDVKVSIPSRILFADVNAVSTRAAFTSENVCEDELEK